MRRSRLLLIALGVLSALVMQALGCSLNPQPIPPVEEPPSVPDPVAGGSEKNADGSDAGDAGADARCVARDEGCDAEADGGAEGGSQ